MPGSTRAERHKLRQAAIGAPWMLTEDIGQAIPPAYTEYIGRQLLEHLAVSRAG